MSNIDEKEIDSHNFEELLTILNSGKVKEYVIALHFKDGEGTDDTAISGITGVYGSSYQLGFLLTMLLKENMGLGEHFSERTNFIARLMKETDDAPLKTKLEELLNLKQGGK